MVSFGPKLTGISLSVLGWMLSVISCGLPLWTVSSFSDEYNRYRYPRVTWWGLWMICESWSTAGQMQCSFHQFIHQGMQALRALSVVAIIVGVLGVFINMVNAMCTNCIQNERIKARLMASSGGLFITAAVAQLVPVFWFVCIAPWDYRYYREKIGVALYLGWAASVLMLIGGSILCCISSPEEDKAMKYNLDGQSYVEYSAIPRSTAQTSDNKRDEV